jgi:ATP synthase protein I
MRNILIFQTLFVLVGTGFSIWQFDATVAKSTLFGGLIAVINSLQMLRHLHRAARVAGSDANRNVKIFYLCAMERLVMTLALFAIGLGALKLAPLPLICGFIIGQFALLSGSYKSRI